MERFDLTCIEAAKLLGKSRRMVRRYAASGLLKSIIIGSNCQRLFSETGVREFIRKRQEKQRQRRVKQGATKNGRNRRD